MEGRQQSLLRRSDVDLVRMDGPATLSNIEQHLKLGFAILHFVGHGKVLDEQGVIYLEKADGTAVATPEQDFTAMVARQSWDAGRLSLVFLCSCQTASANNEHAFDGLGPGLIEAGVPAVIAMQARVRVDTAREFATVFHRDLLQHGIIDRAAPAPVPTPLPQAPGKFHWFRNVIYTIGFLLAMQLVYVLFIVVIAPTPYLEFSTDIMKDSGNQPPTPHHALAKDEVVEPGSFFAQNVKALEAGHFYLWQSCVESNAEASLVLAYPAPARSSSVGKDQTFRIPAESGVFNRLPNCRGNVRFYFVFQTEPLGQFETLLADSSKVVNDEITITGNDLAAVKRILASLKSDSTESSEDNGKIKYIAPLRHSTSITSRPSNMSSPLRDGIRCRECHC